MRKLQDEGKKLQDDLRRHQSELWLAGTRCHSQCGVERERASHVRGVLMEMMHGSHQKQLRDQL